MPDTLFPPRPSTREDFADLDYRAAELAHRAALDTSPTCFCCGRERHVTISVDGTDENRVCADCIGEELAFRVAVRRVSLEATVALYTRQLAETRSIVRAA